MFESSSYRLTHMGLWSLAVASVCAGAGCGDSGGSGGNANCNTTQGPTTAAGSQASTTASTTQASTVSSTSSTGTGGGSGVVVVPQNELVAGLSYAEWSEAWWQWVSAIPAGQNPMVDMTGANCDLNQSGPVFFLAGAPGITDQTIARTCTVPPGKYLFFPVLNYINDYPCPDPGFQPYPGQTLEEFLRAGAVSALGAASSIVVEVDGESFPDGELFRFTSRMFDFTGDPSLIAFDPCITGSVQQGASDGWWIMIEPLPSGEHTVHFAGTNTANGPAFTLDVTYTLTVQ